MTQPMPTSRHRQRGIGSAEYIVGTAITLTVLLAPWGASGENVVQRLIHAVQQSQADYAYVASQPALPRGPGGVSDLPGTPVDDGSAGDGDTGGDPTPDEGGDSGGFNGSGNSGSGNGNGGGNSSGSIGNGNNGGGSDGSGNDGSGIDLGFAAAVAAGVGAAYAYCHVRPTAPEPNLTEEDYRAWRASVKSYADDGAGFKEAGIIYPDPTDGFSASLYKQPDGSYILAFRGTEVRDVDDLKADGRQALLGKENQYDQAVDLAKTVDTKLDAKVVYAGHSLGGGLATAAAYATDGRAITFNSAGLNDYYKKDPRTGEALERGDIRAHDIQGEVLRSVQMLPGLPQAEGKLIVHPRSCSINPETALERHFKCEFADDFAKFRKPPEVCKPQPEDPSGLQPYDSSGTQTPAARTTDGQAPPPQTTVISLHVHDNRSTA